MQSYIYQTEVSFPALFLFRFNKVMRLSLTRRQIAQNPKYPLNHVVQLKLILSWSKHVRVLKLLYRSEILRRLAALLPRRLSNLIPIGHCLTHISPHRGLTSCICYNIASLDWIILMATVLPVIKNVNGMLHGNYRQYLLRSIANLS